MSNSTNINDLPLGNENIQLTLKENTTRSQQNQNLSSQHPPSQETQHNVSLDPNTINQIVNELHQATLTGSTKLVSRDIPMDTLSIHQDDKSSPNYVPEPLDQHKNFIPDGDDLNTIINNENKKIIQENKIDNIYNELQTPILLGVMYFLFQLPIFKKILFQTFPSLFLNDGNLSINGYIFYSTLFSITFYFLNRLVGIFDTF